MLFDDFHLFLRYTAGRRRRVHQRPLPLPVGRPAHAVPRRAPWPTCCARASPRRCALSLVVRHRATTACSPPAAGTTTPRPSSPTRTSCSQNALHPLRRDRPLLLPAVGAVRAAHPGHSSAWSPAAIRRACPSSSATSWAASTTCAASAPAPWVRASGPPAEQTPDAVLNDQTIGGNMQIIGRAEIEFPLFEQVGIRASCSRDTGNAYNLEDQYCRLRPGRRRTSRRTPASNLFDRSTSLRTSWGFGFRWFSPIGPLRFEWGLPVQAAAAARSRSSSSSPSATTSNRGQPGEFPACQAVLRITGAPCMTADALIVRSRGGRAIDAPAKRQRGIDETFRAPASLVVASSRFWSAARPRVPSMPRKLKLGYVDLQRALMETEEGRKARADLKKVFDQKQKELDEQQTELKKAWRTWRRSAPCCRPRRSRQKEAEIQGEAAEGAADLRAPPAGSVGQGAGGHRQDLRAHAADHRQDRRDRELHHGVRPDPGRADLRQAPPGSHQRGHPPLQRRRGQGRRRRRPSRGAAKPRPPAAPKK